MKKHPIKIAVMFRKILKHLLNVEADIWNQEILELNFAKIINAERSGLHKRKYNSFIEFCWIAFFRFDDSIFKYNGYKDTTSIFVRRLKCLILLTSISSPSSHPKTRLVRISVDKSKHIEFLRWRQLRSTSQEVGELR